MIRQVLLVELFRVRKSSCTRNALQPQKYVHPSTVPAEPSIKLPTFRQCRCLLVLQKTHSPHSYIHIQYPTPHMTSTPTQSHIRNPPVCHHPCSAFPIATRTHLFLTTLA